MEGNIVGGGPTLNDVARLAGVSHQTVSRVVNNRPHVSEATRRRVEEALAASGYVPNEAARALAARQSSGTQQKPAVQP